MKTIELNIGLNNNPMSFAQVENFLKENYGANVQPQTGMYNNNPEPTVVARFDVPSDYDIYSAVQRMAAYYSQECIAMKADGNGWLIYDENYKGDKYEFDDEYFLPFINVEFVDVAKNTRSGFYHKSTLYIDGIEISSARISYLNRTWECYRFETSRRAAFGKAKKHLTANQIEVINHILNR